MPRNMSTTEIKERPILFSGPMVRAILDGRKTQTRRVMKPQPPCDGIICEKYSPTVVGRDGEELAGEPIWGAYTDDGEWGLASPYGGPGDRLWVRENFLYMHQKTGVTFQADYQPVEAAGFSGMYGGWKPSIHMPRWASRINLEITGIRAERVQDISSKDVAAEGFPYSSDLDQFKTLWDKINKSRGFDFDSNPFVWVISFRRIP